MQNLDRCEELIQGYVSSLQEGFQSSGLDDGCLIVTPFVRPDGGMIEVEARVLPDGQLRISDLGESIAYLYVNGLTVTSPTIVDIRKLCQRHGVAVDNYELVVEVKDHAAQGQQFHSLMQAILIVTDMIQKRRPYQRLRFDDVVETFLVGNRAVYDSGFRVQGQDTEHTVRFHVDSSRRILIQPLSATNETIAFSWAERWAYRFEDITKHDPQWRQFAVLDDRGARTEVWTPRTLVPLRPRATVVLWSDNAPLAEAVGGGSHL